MLNSIRWSPIFLYRFLKISSNQQAKLICNKYPQRPLRAFELIIDFRHYVLCTISEMGVKETKGQTCSFTMVYLTMTDITSIQYNHNNSRSDQNMYIHQNSVYRGEFYDNFVMFLAPSKKHMLWPIITTTSGRQF